MFGKKACWVKNCWRVATYGFASEWLKFGRFGCHSDFDTRSLYEDEKKNTNSCLSFDSNTDIRLCSTLRLN
jgi:hypothetical protein